MVSDHYSAPLSILDARMVRAVPPGGNWRNIPTDVPSKRLEQIRSSAAEGKGSRSTYYGRLSWDRPAYTISTYFNRPGNGCFIHPEANRLISIREAARLQSFPDSFQLIGSVRKRCILVGNAVPPLLSYQLARTLPLGTFVDLFSGAGGMSLGFEWAGHEHVMSVDHDHDAVATLEANKSGGLSVQADLQDDDRSDELIAMVRVALNGRQLSGLVGGPPCQGFSTAGSSLANDPRNRLVLVMLKWAEALRPRFLLMENVPAIMWRRHRSVLPEIQAKLTQIGYHSVTAVVHAEGYGVPQLRRRLVILAFEDPGDVALPAATHEIREPAFLKFQPGWSNDSNLAASITVTDAISDLPPLTSRDLTCSVPYHSGANSQYQEWARGDLPLTHLIPSARRVEPLFVNDSQLALLR